MSSNCKVFQPFEACTGHGVCLNSGICKCDQGWTSIGDFSTTLGEHCGINLTSIKVLWVFAIIPSFILLYYSTQLIKAKIAKFQSSLSSTQHLNTQKQAYLSWREPAAIFPIFYFLGSVFAIILCSFKLADPEKYAVALHPATSILFFLYACFTIGGTCIYLLVLVNFMDGYAKMMPSSSGQAIKRQSSVVRFAAKLSLVLLVPACFFFPVINVISPNHDIECMIGFSVGAILLVLNVAIHILRYLSIMSKEIKKHLEENKNDLTWNQRNYQKFESAKKKIDMSWMAILCGIFSNIILHSVFLFWPFVIKTSSYFFPTTINGAISICLVFCRSFVNDSNKNISSESRIVSANLNKGGLPAVVIDPSQSNKIALPETKDAVIAVPKQSNTENANVSSARVFVTDDDNA